MSMGEALVWVYLSDAARRACLAHAAATHPREACGVFAAGRSSTQDGLHLVCYVPLTNTAAATDSFALDPVEVARADADLRRRGLHIVAVFHSHVDAPPTPGARDLDGAWAGLPQLILGRGTDGRTACAAWSLAAGRIRRLDLRDRDPSPQRP